MIKVANQPEALLKWMGSLSEATRLRLLGLLERHELGVSDLCDVLQMPQSTVSRHLKLLADEGWVKNRRQGTTNLYHMIADELTPAQQSLWALVREQTSHWATLEQDELRLVERLRQRREDARAFFAGVADEWDRTREELYGTNFTWHALLGMLPGNLVVADLGCGSGSMAGDVAPFVKQVIGIDNSASMLEAARQRTGHLDNIELRQGDLESPPIEDRHCDAALLVLVLTYVPDPMLVVKQMHRILKPGGKAVVVDLLRHDRDDFRRQMGQQSLGFEPAQLNQLLREAGFDEVRTLHVPPEASARGPALLLGTGVRTDA